MSKRERVLWVIEMRGEGERRWVSTSYASLNRATARRDKAWLEDTKDTSADYRVEPYVPRRSK